MDEANILTVILNREASFVSQTRMYPNRLLIPIKTKKEFLASLPIAMGTVNMYRGMKIRYIEENEVEVCLAEDIKY